MSSIRERYHMEDGFFRATIAKSKGKTRADSEPYCSLFDKANIAEWKEGWDKFWREVDAGEM